MLLRDLVTEKDEKDGIRFELMVWLNRCPLAFMEVKEVENDSDS